MTIRLTDQKIDDMVHRIMLRQESSISPNDLMSALKELQGWRRFDSVIMASFVGAAWIIGAALTWMGVS